MDSLKSALADKVLEISSLSEESMKPKLEKINRFRDFIDACHTLIARYPAIEEELARMILNNDFDTKIAASRVDTIIRLSETKTNDTESKTEEDNQEETSEQENQENEIAEVPSEIEVKQTEPILLREADKQALSIEETSNELNNDNNLPSETLNKNIQQNYIEEEKFLPEDIEYEIVEPETEILDKEKEEQYIDCEEVSDSQAKKSFKQIAEENTLSNSQSIIADSTESEETSALNEEEINTNLEDTILEENSNKETFKKIFKVIVIIAVLIALVFIIMFIIKNIKIILIILGITAVVTSIVWWFFIRKKKDTE